VNEETTLGMLPENVKRKSSANIISLNYEDITTRNTILSIILATTVLLVERTCFISAILRGKQSLLIILILISAFNTIYYYIYTLLSKKEHKIALYAAFKLSRTPRISLLTIVFLGYYYFTLIDSSIWLEHLRIGKVLLELDYQRLFLFFTSPL